MRFWTVIIGGLFVAMLAQGQTQEPSTESRLQKLEAAMNEMASKAYSRQGTTQAFLAESLNIGGFFESSLTSVTGPDTPSQIVADSQRLGLNLAAEIQPKLRLVSQFSLGFSYAFRNEHNNPNHGSSFLPTQRTYQEVAFGSLLSQAFGEYEFLPNHRIEMGMGFVPFGKAYQVREPVLFLKKRGPQMIRTSGINRVLIADPFWKGFQLLGQLLENDLLNYNLYTNSPLSHSGKLGVGGRFSGKTESGFDWGLSVQQGYQEDQQYLSSGVDLSWSYYDFGISTEWAQFQTKASTNESFYVQIFYKILDRSLTLFIDTDYFRNPFGQTLLGSSVINDPYIKWENSVGVNYNFSANSKVRAELIQHDYVGDRATLAGQIRDYVSGALSCGISF